MEYRIEKDSIGEKQVPVDAYYGVQSMRGCENFHITGQRMQPEFINSMAEIKKACAICNCQVGELDVKIKDAICQACDEIIAGKLHDQFLCDPIQGGAGTTANMTANEVIANRAIEILGGTKGDYSIVHPNDHVNRAQSTNDVFPSAAKLTAAKLLKKAIAQVERLEAALAEKEKEFHDIIKMGRTQMQDAVPIRLGAEFGAYRKAIKRDIVRLNTALEGMYAVNMGGTAVGTALNANPAYVEALAPELAKITGLPLVKADDLVDGTQNLDAYAYVSASLKTCAISCSKMANDFRLMSSGPRCGFQEINLPAKQNGSSIMPGKVNPVIPEVMSQAAFCIMGNDVCITMAAEAGQLELNVMEPVIVYALFNSMQMLTKVMDRLRILCIDGITANADRCKDMVMNSIGIVTALNPTLGYENSSRIAKRALTENRSVYDLVLEEKLLTKEELDNLLRPELMIAPKKFYKKK